MLVLNASYIMYPLMTKNILIQVPKMPTFETTSHVYPVVLDSA